MEKAEHTGLPRSILTELLDCLFALGICVVGAHVVSSLKRAFLASRERLWLTMCLAGVSVKEGFFHDSVGD